MRRISRLFDAGRLARAWHALRHFTDDHSPPHVHVRGVGEVRIALDHPHAVLSNKGMRKPDIVRARNAVEERQNDLLNVWIELHG